MTGSFVQMILQVIELNRGMNKCIHIPYIECYTGLDHTFIDGDSH